MAISILPGTTRSGGHARVYKPGAGLRMRGATSGRVGILPPATITDYDLTLPVALGASDKLMQVSSAGVVSLVDPVTIGGTGTELLYRGGASSAAAVAGSSWDATTLTLPKTTISGNNLIAQVGADPAVLGIGTSTTVGAFLGGYYSAGANSSTIYFGQNYYYRDVPSGEWVIPSSGQKSARMMLQGGSIYFSTGNANNTVPKYRMTIRSSGEVVIGNDVTSGTPAAGYLYGTGGSGTNVVGGTLYIGPGPSTGNATPSSIILQSSVAGTSGSTAQTLVDTLTVTNNLVRLAATAYQYWGPEGIDGSWRIGRSGNDIVIERRESGVWVTKSTISA